MALQQRLAEHTVEESYATHVNRQWVRLLTTLGMDKRFVSSSGAEVVTDDGVTYLDFLGGYGVYNIGHHHPKLHEAIIDELAQMRPTMLQSYVPELAAELAERLCGLAPKNLTNVFFTSTGSEGVETVIKFARAFTRRDGILYANGGFHGLTCGALSLMSNSWWKEGFGSLLPNTVGVPFGDLDELELQLKTQRFAAFVTEPIQGESGVIVPSPEYLKSVQELCRKYGTLFVLDEVQTGIFRTGKFLAAQSFGVEPDMVVLAKAMSGGLVPVGAVLMTPEINEAVYSSLDRAFIHASTFGENALAMRACLATLDIIESEKLGERAVTLGERLRSRLQPLTKRYEMLKEVRGLGLMNGIEFQAPQKLSLKVLHSSFSKIHPGVFGQMVVKHLFEPSHILTQMSGNNYMVIKACPPLVVSEAQVDAFTSAFEQVLEVIHFDKGKFWAQGLSIAKRAFSARNV